MNIRSIFIFLYFVSSIHFYKYFFYLFNENLVDIINNFNYKSLYISKQYEYICLDLMKELYNKHLLILDTTTYVSSNNVVNLNVNFIDNIKNDAILWPSVINIIASGTKTILFTDLISIYETFFFTGELITTYTINKLLEFTNNKIISKNTLKISNKYRQINNDIYTLSNIYCTHTFHIHMDIIDNNYLVIIGDSIDYYWIIYLLQTIETNIKIILENNLNKNKIHRDLLVSLYERIITLRNVVQQLQIIVYYSFNKINNDLFKYNNLSKNSLDYDQQAILFIKDYLDKIIYKLVNMLYELYKSFPIQENEKKHILKLTKEKNIIYDMDYNITQLEKFTKKDNWNKYLLDIQIVFIDTCNEYSKMIAVFIKGLSNIAVSPLTGIIQSIGIQLNNLLSLMIFSKNGLTIICFIILVCNLANIIRLVMHIIIQFSRKFIFE